MSEVSVIIPVYNRPELVKEAVASAASQSISPELIVADDGSVPPLSSFNPSVTLLRTSENKGVSNARNRGAEAAKGKYLAFLDSDDLFLPRKLEKQLEFMRKRGIKASHTSEKWFKNGTFVNQGKKHARYGGFIFEKVLDFCRISPSAFMIERELFLNLGGFDESLRVCEDYEFFLRLTSLYEVGYLEEELTVKRAIAENSLSKSIRYIESLRLEILERFAANFVVKEGYRAALERELERKRQIVGKGLKKKQLQNGSIGV